MKFKNKLVLLISFIGFMILAIILTRKYANVGLTIKMIEDQFKGVVIEKYSPRNTPPTMLKINISDKIIEIVPNEEIIELVSIGDSIIKYKNENYVDIIKPNGIKRKLFYTKISYKTRSSFNFPKEWKNKWLESSEWDK